MRLKSIGGVIFHIDCKPPKFLTMKAARASRHATEEDRIAAREYEVLVAAAHAKARRTKKRTPPWRGPVGTHRRQDRVGR